MSMNHDPINKKVTIYIDNLFAGVGPSQQLFDLKEELVTNLKEKIADIKSWGLDDEQAFKEAVISMGDLGGLVDDMRQVGQDSTKQEVYSSMTTNISTVGIVAGVLLILFGMFTVAMLYFMGTESVSVAGSSIFVVAGGSILTYSILTRETNQKYGMNKIRALGYGLSVGLILFSLFTAFTTLFATGEMFIAIASLMVFFMAGIGLFLLLILTGSNRNK